MTNDLNIEDVRTALTRMAERMSPPSGWAGSLDDLLTRISAATPDMASSPRTLTAAVPSVTNRALATTRRPRWRRPLLLAAAVVLLIAGGLTVQVLRSPSVDPAAAAVLNRAADAADRAAASGADVIPPGHYRYTVTDAWYVTMSSALTYRQQSTTQVWMPADWHDTWLVRQGSTGARQWIYGSEEQALAEGLAKDGTPTVDPDYRGACAAYFTNVCTGPGSWQTPTEDWIAALPTDAADMYSKLYRDSEGHGQSQESEMLVQATDALKTGLLPAKVRATLYRAMAMIGGVTISDNAVNLDGHTGTGFTVDSPWIRDETIIDPKTGDYIGTREIVLKDDPTNHLKAGTLLGYTAVSSTIVATLGSTK